MATNEYSLEKLKRRASEVWLSVETVSGSPVEVLEKAIASREAELMEQGNQAFKPEKSPPCYGDLYDPTVEEEYQGRQIRPCVVCVFSRPCSMVVRQRFGRAPGDTMPPASGTPKPKKVPPPALIPPKRIPPLATRPKDPRTGLTIGSKINSIVLCLMEGPISKSDILDKLVEIHGGEKGSSQSTMAVAMTDLKAGRYPNLPAVTIHPDGKWSMPPLPEKKEEEKQPDV